jgi:hypothetical protein
LPENVNCYSNKIAKRIIKEIKNLEKSLESTTRNPEGTKKAVKKLKKIQSLINEAQYDNLLSQNEYNTCSKLLYKSNTILIREKFEGKF